MWKRYYSATDDIFIFSIDPTHIWYCFAEGFCCNLQVLFSAAENPEFLDVKRNSSRQHRLMDNANNQSVN